MANPLYNMLMNNSVGMNFKPNNVMNIISQVRQLQNNPGQILDILLQSGKINQQQYNELQPYKNNPQQIFNYLVNNGNANALKQAQQQAGQITGQI